MAQEIGIPVRSAAALSLARALLVSCLLASSSHLCTATPDEALVDTASTEGGLDDKPSKAADATEEVQTEAEAGAEPAGEGESGVDWSAYENAEVDESFVPPEGGYWDKLIKQKEADAAAQALRKTLDLTAGNWAEFVEGVEADEASAAIVLVDFYAPWCGHCQELSPVLDELSAKYKQRAQSGEGVHVTVAKVDCTVEEELKERFDISGYPTIKLFKSGKPITYAGDRSLKDLDEFVTAWTEDVLEVEPTKEAVAAFVSAQRKAGKHSLVAFFESQSTPGAQEVVVLGPEFERDDGVILAMCYTSSPTLSIGASDGGGYGVRFFDARDPSLTDWLPVDASTDPIELARSVKKVAWPFFKWHTEGDITKAFDKGFPVVMCGIDEVPYHTELVRELQSAARKMRGKVATFFIPNDQLGVLRELQLPPKAVPAIKVLDARVGGLKRYSLPQNAARSYTADELLSFQQAALEGLDPHGPSREYRSTPPFLGETNRTYVKTAVGTNFVDVVFNAEAADVFVEFYAPWCPHCKRFTTPYLQMAKRFSEIPSLKFVKIDATENELRYEDAPEVPEVHGYPTLFHFKRDRLTGERVRVPVKYPFALTPDNVEQLAEYIAANASQPFYSYGSYFGHDCDICSEFQAKVPGKCLSCLGSKIVKFLSNLVAPTKQPEVQGGKTEL